MKFNLAKTAAIISVVRMAAGAAAGNPVDAAQAAQVVGAKSGSVYNKRTATDFRRLIAYSTIIAAMKFLSAPSVAIFPECAALFMATFGVMVGYAIVLRQNPLGTDLVSSLIVTGIYGIGLASVICALDLAVGHPLEVAIVPLGVKIAFDCAFYLVMCWFCDKVLKKCHRF